MTTIDESWAALRAFTAAPTRERLSAAQMAVAALSGDELMKLMTSPEYIFWCRDNCDAIIALPPADVVL